MVFIGFLKNFVCYTVVVVLMLSAGCASTVTSPDAVAKQESDEQALVRRAQERWDALLAMNFEKAYGYISPGGRLKYSLEEYSKRVRGEFWRGTKAKSAACQPDYCVVTLDFQYEVSGLKLSQAINETWIQDGGVWWFVYQP